MAVYYGDTQVAGGAPRGCARLQADNNFTGANTFACLSAESGTDSPGDGWTVVVTSPDGTSYNVTLTALVAYLRSAGL